MAKLTEKSTEVFEYVKNAGGKVSIPELCEALNRAPRSVGANVTDLTKKGLAERQQEKDGEEEVTYVALVPGWEAAFDALDPKRGVDTITAVTVVNSKWWNNGKHTGYLSEVLSKGVIYHA